MSTRRALVAGLIFGYSGPILTALLSFSSETTAVTSFDIATRLEIAVSRREIIKQDNQIMMDGVTSIRIPSDGEKEPTARESPQLRSQAFNDHHAADTSERR